MDDQINTHEEHLEYIEHYLGEPQHTNAFRILSFLEYGNKSAVKCVSKNPHVGITAYYSVPATKRWAGIMTGNDKILLLADKDLVESFSDQIKKQGLEIVFLSLNRGAVVIPTTQDGGFVDEDGNLSLDMQFVVDFGKHCLAEGV